MVFQITAFENVIDFSFVWCSDVMTSCHDVTKLHLLISACRYDRKMIFSRFFVVFWSHRFQKGYWFFMCYVLDVLTSWRNVTTTQSLFHPSLLVDSLERWFFSWFHGFSGCWFWKCYRLYIFVGWYHVISSRHDVASILTITLLHLSYLVVGPYCDSYSNSMVIWVVGIKTIINTFLQAAASIISQRRVMTSRCDVMPSYEIEALLVFFQFSHANWPGARKYCSIVAHQQAQISEIRFVISWRDVMMMTSLHEVKSSCKC